MSKHSSLFVELKRRNVLRSSALYIGVAWALAQGISQLAPALGLPAWAPRAFLIACAIGLPFWFAFGWFYELTPEGFKRDEELAPDAPARRSNARKLDLAIIGILIVIVALLGSGYFIRGTSPITRSAAFDPPPGSIVVLPFANLSQDPDERYFSNGITEELTDALGQNTSLTVIAWNTASRYAQSTQSPREIGRTLNVAHVLAGSIQRAGDVVRVTTELVDASTGRQVWSAHYDDTLENIFAVQDKISAAIARSLQATFAGMQPAPTRNPEAHQSYLMGLAALEGNTGPEAQAAQSHFQHAVQVDPQYADAWAGLAASYLALAQWSTLPIAEATVKMRDAAHKALTLDPHNVNALVELGNADNADGDTTKASAAYRKAIALDPSSARAHLDYGTALPLKQDLVQTREAARLDPDNATAQNNLATLFQDLGDWQGMVGAARVLNKLSPRSTDAAFYLAFAYSQMQRPRDAAAAFNAVHPTNPSDRQLADAGRLAYGALVDPSQRPQALAALEKLRGEETSPYAQGNLLQLYLALGERQTALRMLPVICAEGPVGCNDLAINPIYAPLRGDPAFQALAKKYTTLTLK